jgi:hypothetical protein
MEDGVNKADAKNSMRHMAAWLSALAIIAGALHVLWLFPWVGILEPAQFMDVEDDSRVMALGVLRWMSLEIDFGYADPQADGGVNVVPAIGTLILSSLLIAGVTMWFKIRPQRTQAVHGSSAPNSRRVAGGYAADVSACHGMLAMALAACVAGLLAFAVVAGLCFIADIMREESAEGAYAFRLYSYGFMGVVPMMATPVLLWFSLLFRGRRTPKRTANLMTCVALALTIAAIAGFAALHIDVFRSRHAISGDWPLTLWISYYYDIVLVMACGTALAIFLWRKSHAASQAASPRLAIAGMAAQMFTCIVCLAMMYVRGTAPGAGVSGVNSARNVVIALALFMVIWGVWIVAARILMKQWMHRHAVITDQCYACGYDIRMIHADRCPECGYPLGIRTRT